MSRQYRLTPKQEAFCWDYVATSNAKLSYQNVYGASENKAQKNAWTMMANPKIEQRVREIMYELNSERILKAEEVLEELTLIAKNEKEATGSRLRALELIGKHYSLFTDKVQVEGELKQVQVNLVGFDEEEPVTIDMKEE